MPRRRPLRWYLTDNVKGYYDVDAAKLKAAFAPLLEQGQRLISQYGGAIAERVRTIDVRNLPALIKSA